MTVHTFSFIHPEYILRFSLQFIDGRLDLLNSGEGFNDIFEEEINMGEYAGDYANVSCLFYCCFTSPFKLILL